MNTQICTGLRNGGLVLWDNVFNTHKHALQKHSDGPVTCCSFFEHPSVRPSRLLSGSQGGSVHMYDAVEGTLLRVVATLPGSVRMLITTGIPVFLTVDARKQIRVYNDESSQCVATIELPQPPAGVYVCMCVCVCMYNDENSQCVATVELPQPPAVVVVCVYTYI